MASTKDLLLAGLTPGQRRAVTSDCRRILIVAGAGSGKTEVMARRIAWWVAIEGVAKDRVVAFTFTDRAAEEMKFRIRGWMEKTIAKDEELALGGMYIGTIHGYCLAKLREFWPDDYHNFDILDEGARTALILRGFNGLLALNALQAAVADQQREKGQFPKGRYAILEEFGQAYDQLHEHCKFDVKLASGDAPFELGSGEREWCGLAHLITNVGDTPAAIAFGTSAARYYAYLRCRRFLDFSTSQSEFVRRLAGDKVLKRDLSEKGIHLVVDEIQDINPVQLALITSLTGTTGHLTAVGDHRQSIYGFRGARVEIIGSLWQQFSRANDSDVVDLEENFRSTPRIIELANSWAASIGALGSMRTPAMKHGNRTRLDQHSTHVALVSFDDRLSESTWIADAVRVLVPSDEEGANHDKRDGSHRGLALSDIAVLVRSSTDVRTYMRAMEASKIPCIVRAGPDLFSQPEVMLFLAAFAITAGHTEFFGSQISPKSLPKRIEAVLHCAPLPVEVLRASSRAIRELGLAFDEKTEEGLLRAAGAIGARLLGDLQTAASLAKKVQSPKLRVFLTTKNPLRRVFPQQIYHMLLAEAQVEAWDTCGGRGETALFHLGALSRLVTGLETPGWTSVDEYPWQLIGLYQYGEKEGRAEEQPLMVQPDAVSISTIHGAKGLEFAAVFLADVNARRFPSGFARRQLQLPLSGSIVDEIDVEGLADNENHDGERRLMYVALTRAERFLFITHSGRQVSKFIKELRPIVEATGGVVTDNPAQVLDELRYSPKEHRRDIRLSTSFSDLRYYLECSHDFYLRKVLGFSPTIDQAFGYGRGVHNLMRAIHSDPKRWGELAKDRKALEVEIQRLIQRGLFYLRYTTGDPATNMRMKGARIVAEYIQRYASELDTLIFEPEKAFETLVEYEDGNGGALVSGAIDVIRQDNPPRVTLIDFKSGDVDSDGHQKLDTEEMQLQVALYALAVKKELEYQPDQGLVRYLDEANPLKAELNVPLDSSALNNAKRTVAQTAAKIRNRQFGDGPAVKLDGTHRCKECDFIGFCGMKEARAQRKKSGW